LVDWEQHIPTTTLFRKLFSFGSIFVAKEFSCELVIPKYIHESLPRPNPFRNRRSFAKVTSLKDVW
jgi:hypothetical protein